MTKSLLLAALTATVLLAGCGTAPSGVAPTLRGAIAPAASAATSPLSIRLVKGATDFSQGGAFELRGENAAGAFLLEGGYVKGGPNPNYHPGGYDQPTIPESLRVNLNTNGTPDAAGMKRLVAQLRAAKLAPGASRATVAAIADVIERKAALSFAHTWLATPGVTPRATTLTRITRTQPTNVPAEGQEAYGYEAIGRDAQGAFTLRVDHWHTWGPKADHSGWVLDNHHRFTKNGRLVSDPAALAQLYVDLGAASIPDTMAIDEVWSLRTGFVNALKPDSYYPSHIVTQ